MSAWIRAASLFAAASAAACAAAPPPEPLGAPPVKSAAPVEALPPPAPDELVRYRPPLLDLPARWLPPPATEARLPGGARLHVIERHDLPLVSLVFELRREERPRIPGIEQLAFHALLDGPPPGRKGLFHGLTALGMSVRLESTLDVIALRLQGPASSAGEAAAMVARALARFAPDEPLVEAARGRTARWLEGRERGRPSQEGRRARLFRAADEIFLPADHRYREPPITVPDVTRTKAADVDAWRAQALVPNRLRIGAAGDVTRAALVAALEPALQGWKPGRAGVAKLPSPPRGAFLFDEPGAGRAELMIIWPDLPVGAEDAALASIVRNALRTFVFDRLRAEIKTGWDNGLVYTFDRGDHPPNYVAVAIDAPELPKAARLILDALERAAKGEIPEALLDGERGHAVRHFEGLYASTEGAARRAAMTARFDLAPDALTRHQSARIEAGAAQFTAVARALLARREMRLFAMGEVASTESAIAALGLGKVTVVRGAATGGKP